MEKRQYNRERQQHLRRVETHERQMLKVQIRQLELELQDLQHRNQSGNNIIATPAQLENRSLKRRMQEYSNFMQEMANWANQIVGSITSDSAWIGGLEDGKPHSSPSSLPDIELDLKSIPSGQRKRLYNRMRQRMYRRREIEEVDHLQQQIQDLSHTLDCLTKGRKRHAFDSVEHTKNKQLKTRLDQHKVLASSIVGWINHTSTQIHLDQSWIAAR
ncbi:hypothetical protein THRCLA_01090 [Thraustotheca clavata]|uniref:BZIP domain-containing protein n=1 Tax=Thraustotheca clavata TaxID=74557 RepID=A0A1W0A9A6_9STRA|nr:hypothetical protein THRCLA_01090 [Thraustotheca clavata]